MPTLDESEYLSVAQAIWEQVKRRQWLAIMQTLQRASTLGATSIPIDVQLLGVAAMRAELAEHGVTFDLDQFATALEAVMRADPLVQERTSAAVRVRAVGLEQRPNEN